MASPNERLLYASKTDSEDMLKQVLDLPEGTDGFDVNFQDGLGMTALHYAVQTPSPTALDLLLEYDGLDVDLQSRIHKYTPLHLACQLEDESARYGVVEMLVEAGADPRIKDAQNSFPSDYLNPHSSEADTELVKMLKIAIGELDMSATSNGNGTGKGGKNEDIASDDEGEEGEGEFSGEE